MSFEEQIENEMNRLDWSYAQRNVIEGLVTEGWKMTSNVEGTPVLAKGNDVKITVTQEGKITALEE